MGLLLFPLSCAESVSASASLLRETVNPNSRDKAASPVMAGGGPVTAEETVTLSSPSGTVQAELTLPSGSILGEAVVFEEVLMKAPDGRETLVGVHKDLRDEAQMVTLYPSGTRPKRLPPVQTGDTSGTLLWMISSLLAAAAILFAAILLRKRKRG